MTTGHASELYALTAEPRCVRAGDTVTLTFRTRNLGAVVSPSGSVCFSLDDGLVPLDACAAGVEGVAPGEDIVARVRAKAPAVCDDRTVLTATATLRIGDATFTTNACGVVVRSRPVLDGAGSGTFVDACEDETVRVRAVVVNEGDGPARDVALVVPVPAGCERADGADDEIVRVARLQPGARCEGALHARIVRPVRDVRCDDATVTCANVPRTIVPARSTLQVAALLAISNAGVSASRTRVDVALAVCNDGWVEARDVRLEVRVPRELRPIEWSVLVDGVPASARAARRDAPIARIERTPERCAVVIASLPARERTAVELAFAVPPGGVSGEIVAAVDGREARLPFATPRTGEVCLRIVDAPAVATPGEVARADVVVANTGDDPVTVRCCAAGHDARGASIALAPRSFARARIDVPIPGAAMDGEILESALLVTDADGERARATFRTDVRVRPGAVPAELDPDDGAPHGARVDAALSAPERVAAGTAFDVCLEIRAVDDVERVRVQAALPEGARYAFGSCRLDGSALADRNDGAEGAAASPLDGRGIELCAMRAGAAVAVTWSLLAGDAGVDGATVDVGAQLTVDAGAHHAVVRTVAVEPRAMFAVRPARLPFYVVDCSVTPSAEPAAPASADAAREAAPAAGEPSGAAPIAPHVTRHIEAIVAPPAVPDIEAALAPGYAATLRLGDERTDTFRRLHHALRGDGLVAHLFVLRLFFPEIESASDPLREPFDSVRTALEDVYDRLYVKLRIPGFDVCADDVDDARLRVSVDALFEGLGTSSPRAESAPCGSPAVLRALLGLLDAPCAGDATLASAIAAHVRALDDALARYDGLPLELFDDALARGGGITLDDARRALLDALAPYVSRVPC